MNPTNNSEAVSFITSDDGDDLIVSFALEDDEPGEVVSLTLLRTPKYESILPDDERGVSVSHEVEFDDDGEYLRRIRLATPITAIESTRKRYELDVSGVDRAELKAAGRTLTQMNFDQQGVSWPSCVANRERRTARRGAVMTGASPAVVRSELLTFRVPQTTVCDTSHPRVVAVAV